MGGAYGPLARWVHEYRVGDRAVALATAWEVGPQYRRVTRAEQCLTTEEQKVLFVDTLINN